MSVLLAAHGGQRGERIARWCNGDSRGKRSETTSAIDALSVALAAIADLT